MNLKVKELYNTIISVIQTEIEKAEEEGETEIIIPVDISDFVMELEDMGYEITKLETEKYKIEF